MVFYSKNVTGLQITDLTVPRSVRNGSNYVILDCQYALLPDDLNPNSGLVVKWFYNNSPSPVYQWIPGKKPQDLGLLRGRLDLDYRVSDHNSSMHRALFIKNPTTELSGDYKCMVSTFLREDFMTKRMVVFAPGKEMILLQKKPDLERVNITCIAQGIYPEPHMALYKDLERKTKLIINNTIVEKYYKNGAYNITASALIEDENLITPVIFECELFIPDAKYHAKKSSVFYPG
ncbi:conserved hypothetical protein [Pediculus humanus corporis]|uniref:Ig-like domain-containing protein n=1 Tax=Pediculus humanus subsp. corporis TaxID=121224 RepID=E0VA58_PEDHC|nr:uncharacterized protein Phum_PHUM027590 [Pediculus humanus corporis]EEB10264.1 conserved hypothetical protein [Pediculus humanus corporis]